MPRKALSASAGDGVAPCSTEYAQIESSSSVSPETTPSVASLWPAMPLVAECSERCTPWASGCWPSGVANVESTTVNGPRRAPSSSRSTSSSRGLEGVSASTSIVRPGCTAAANAPGSVPSTRVRPMPMRAHGPCRNASVPAYNWRWATMWSPLEQSANTTVASAPIPEANASESSAPSSDAIASSNDRTVGFA